MRILLVEGHPLVRLALQTLITRLQPQAAVLALGDVFAARRHLSSEGEADLALLDQSLTDADGGDPLPALRAEFATMPVAVLADSDRSTDVLRAVDAGAMGFVNKRAPMAELLHGLDMLLQGGVFLPGSMQEDAHEDGAEDTPAHSANVNAVLEGTLALSQAWQGQRAGGSKLPPRDAPAPLRYALLGLTQRQGEVLDLLLKGLSNKVIAREMQLSVETVKDHVAAVLRALGVSSRTQAVLAVSRRLEQARAAESR